MYVCMHVCIYMHACMCVYVCMCMHVCTSVCIRVQEIVYIRESAYVCTCMHIRTLTHQYISTNPDTHPQQIHAAHLQFLQHSHDRSYELLIHNVSFTFRKPPVKHFEAPFARECIHHIFARCFFVCIDMNVYIVCMDLVTCV
jgi:hypothetical protein